MYFRTHPSKIAFTFRMSAETIRQKIAILEEALAEGALSVEYDGKKVTFDNANALIRRINYFKSQLDSVTGHKTRGPRRQVVYTRGNKGL